MITYFQTTDGSIINSEGQVIYFSLERFKTDICNGNCCFICGCAPGSKPFNDEHILPDWLLRRFDLHHKAIGLPNETIFRYDQYKIACCAECNALMGKRIEEPISKLISCGYETFTKALSERGHEFLFVWMALIFLKTHLKDRNFRTERDLRKASEPISEMYEWGHLHHLHSIARSFYINAEISPDVLGSFLVIPVRSEIPEEDAFDYGDLYAAQTMLLKMNDIGIVTVFNDSCGAINRLEHTLSRIRGAVSSMQLRELMTELACINLHIKQRPVFRTQTYDYISRPQIVADVPDKVELNEFRPALRGQLMRHVLGKRIDRIEPAGITKEEFIAGIESGHWTFLFDKDGEFIKKTFTKIDSAK